MKKKNGILLILFLIGAAFSVFTISVYGFDKVWFGDAQDYINGANAFLNNTPYPRVSEFHPMFRPPLFSMLIAAIWKIFPESVIAVKLFQALLHAGTVLIVYKIVFEVVKKQIPAILGALVCAFNPLLAGHTVDFYTEPLHAFLCAAAMLFLLRSLKSEERKYFNSIVAGMFFGLSALNRPAILGVVVVLAFFVALFEFTGERKIKSLATAFLMIFSMFAVIAPWTIQNYRDTGEFVLINDGFSYNLWLGNLRETLPLYESEFETKEENQKFADHIWGEVQLEKIKELEQTDNYSSLKINEKEKVWRREAVKNMSADKESTARLMIGKFRSFWTPFVNKFTYGKTLALLIAAYTIFVFVFGFLGMYIFSAYKAGGKFVILLLATFAVTTLIHVLIFGFVRYRVPNVDPYLSMLAGVSIRHLILKIFPNNKFLQN